MFDTVHETLNHDVTHIGGHVTPNGPALRRHSPGFMPARPGSVITIRLPAGYLPKALVRRPSARLQPGLSITLYLCEPGIVFWRRR